MKKVLIILSALTVLVLLFLSCGKDDNNNNNTGTNPNPTGIQITVSSGNNPQYSWSGGNVFSVSVVRQSAPTVVVWGAVTPGADGIASPVTHGTLPAGAVQTSISNTETTLMAGVPYRVTVSRINGTDTGYTDFTP